MYSEEETELRDLIIQNLENCGFLNKIKAELRAGVFLALEEDGNLKNKIPLFNKKFDDFVVTKEGKLLLSLVREFLEFFNLHFTLSVFEPEVGATTPYASRSELCDQFKLSSKEIDGPVISVLLKEKINIIENHCTVSKSTDEFKSLSKLTEKSSLADANSMENNNYGGSNEIVLNNGKSSVANDLERDNFVSKNLSNDIKKKSSNEVLSNLNTLSNLEKEVLDNSVDKDVTDNPVAKHNQIDNVKNTDKIEEAKPSLSDDLDPFFDEPLPSEKSSFFSFTEISKDKSENKLSPGIKKTLDEPKKGSLSSLRDLPSLTANNEWTFSREPLNTLPSLESQKSVSSSEASNEEINLDSKDNFFKKDTDIIESNEESSEKQNSEESIEEEIEEDFSAGFEDILNSSLSLGDDVTTDQTVSQISVVEGVDHVEPCNS